MSADISLRYPRLFAPQRWEWGDIDASFSLQPPPEELVGNIHLIAYVGTNIVVCRNDLGWRFLPGGTREPGETLEDTARRELREEAGATLMGPMRFIGAFQGRSGRPVPYRPHLPYPVSYWVYCAAPVIVDGPPTNPPDGEQVQEVAILPVQQAAAWLSEYDEVMADIVRLDAERNPV